MAPRCEWTGALFRRVSDRIAPPNQLPRQMTVSFGGYEEIATMGLLTFNLNVTLDGCVDHQEGIADDETHAFLHPPHGRKRGDAVGAASPTR